MTDHSEEKILGNFEIEMQQLDGETEKEKLINGQTEQVGETQIPPVSIFRLIALTISFLGVQFGWALQIAFTSPLFLELGVPKGLVSFVWLAGPISGLLVQPIVGFFSDKTTSRLGRRRPYILGGAISIAIGMLLISNAASLGTLLGDKPNEYSRAIALAVVGFWILDLSNNTVQGPCRALLVDVAAPSQQNLGGSLFSLMLGIGNLAGYYIGSLPLATYMPFFKTDLRAMFTIGGVVMLTCIAITVLFVPEKRFEKPTSTSDEPSGCWQIFKSQRNPLVAIFSSIWKMPPDLRRVCVVQFFGWLAWFNYLLYITTWVGENIYGGNPNAPQDSEANKLFDEGVKEGSFGLAINAVVTVIFSLGIPFLAAKIGIKITYFIGQIWLAGCFLATIWIKTPPLALTLIALFGVPWAVVMVLPFSLVALIVPPEKSGIYMGALNVFVCVPQILIALFVGFLIDRFAGNVVVAMVTGSIAAAISAVTCLFLKVPEISGPMMSLASGGH